MVAEESGSKEPGFSSQILHSGSLQATGLKSEWPGAAAFTQNMSVLTSLAKGVMVT